MITRGECPAHKYHSRVDQITPRSGYQLQPPESARKEKEEEMSLKDQPTSENPSEKNEKEALSSISNSKGAIRDKELTKDSKMDPSIPVPF